MHNPIRLCKFDHKLNIINIANSGQMPLIPFPSNFSSLSLSSNPSPSLSSAMDENLPLQKVSIAGPTLSSLLHRFSSSPSNIEGVLFGKLSSQAPCLLDDDDVSPSQSSLIAVITSFASTSGDVTSLLRLHHDRQIIGWFSGRRRSALRPSFREFRISQSLSSDSSRIFLLLTTPSQDNQTLIHTHDYKLYQFLRPNQSFEPTQLDVVNIGPAFRGHYGAFSPNSELPLLPCEFHGGSPMREDTEKVEDSKELGSYVEKYELEGLSRLMGSDAVNYMSGVEEFYEKMLAKLDCLARQVETSSAKVLEMENHNMKLRHRVAGIE